ncbi:DEAD/DEAH box helicase [Caldibacillus lycopersici]|uniref:DEAD/DEAH box helicase n=1 Tax=Perspicuibacillus lycopersici TaxID=1325689 RepID=A0AAE3IVS7_9BACI|nr:DEAD/DEAH box helicase [Perspicuibacillus lycopersici]
MPDYPVDSHYPYVKELQLFLSGRQLLLEEIPFALAIIHEHVLHGYVRYLPGIVFHDNKYQCQRCGNDEQRLFGSFACARCQKQCSYCRKCLMMGRVSQCTPLLTWSGPEPAFRFPNALAWEGTLSIAQKEAAEKIREAVESNGDLLVWAVCGAGKTEMLFYGMQAALTLGKRVAIATPRTDVVLELTPRMRQVFPTVPIASLFGGSEERHLFAPIVITTTHQLLRFKEAFDVMIIDEVDAFPFTADRMLQNAAAKARKQGGTEVFLTATPSIEWQRECAQRKRNHYILPARFHRHELPIPKFVWCGNWKKSLKKGRIPKKLLQWVLQRLKTGKQSFVFFPHIQLMEQSLPLFQQYHPDIQAVHSEDPNRKEKVQQMRNGKIPLLLTTTILERGVTIPNLDVAVLGAEDDTFTESALVQIAGRVGRSQNDPTGDVSFFHYGKTNAMIRARAQLLRMNKEARKRGLVD